MTQIGESCPDCGAAIGVLNTYVAGETRVRYLGCRCCGWRPPHNKQTLPLRFSPRRSRRRRRRRRGA